MTSPSSFRALTDELVRRGYLGAGSDAAADATVANDRPWFISIVLGVSGWLAGAFVLLFVGMLFAPETPAGMALSGVILLAAAFGLYAADRNSEFFDQLALAFSIAGQFALTWAASEGTDSATATAALALLLQVALLFAMPNDLSKLLAAFFASCAWALTIRFAWWGDDVLANARQSVAIGPALIAWLVVWAPIIGAVHVLVSTERLWMAGPLRRIARPALTGLLLSLCVATWVSEPLTALYFWEDEPGRTNWRVLWPLLGAATALLAATYAFRLRNRAILGVAIAGALLHIAQFYYLLGTTLLIKSVVMIAVGVVALAWAGWLRKKDASQEETA